MDFFEAQDEARRRTLLLVVLFVLAVLALIALTNLVVMGAIMWSNRAADPFVRQLAPTFDPHLFVAVSAGVVAIVVAGTLYKLSELSGGGRVVAESLGGRPVARDTDDPLERRLLNIVDEMAIASGTPVPPVYVMNYEKGINAFAAGLAPADAVIAVTRGAIVQLDRDQLQGVIGHEFSHILRGDMRLNVRLMGMVHGILMLGLIGQYLMRSMSFGGRGRNARGGAPVMAMGVGLMVLGYGGTFFGNLIKAAVSRQREFLADAGSVQFTRNPDGIAGALKRIGGLSWGFRLMSPGAPSASHMLFGPGVQPVMAFLFATHPPLKDRIRRLDRRWDGRFDAAPELPDPKERPPLPAGEEGRQVRRVMGAVLASAATVDAVGAVQRIGAPDEAHIEQAQALLAQVPEDIRIAVSDGYGARAVIYALLCDPDEAVCTAQLAHLDGHADTGVAALTRRLHPEVAKLDPRLRLPVVDLALPALKALSPEQVRMFAGNLRALMQADHRLSLFEWCIGRMVRHHLERAHGRRPPMQEARLHIALAGEACRVLLSALAHAGADGPGEAEAAFDAALRYLQLPGLTLLGPDTDVHALDAALSRLATLGPLHKRRLLKAAIACIHADGKVSPAQAELIRVISDALECPMPPPVR